MSRQCFKCKNIKSNKCFYFRSDKPHLLDSYCKKCISNDRKIYRLNNIEKFKLKDIIYYENNKEKRKEYSSMWHKNNRDHINSKFNKRMKTDVSFAMRTRIHNRIRMALKRNSKYSTSTELLGCDIIYFREYFKSKFIGSMNWKYFLSGDIHIDHIIPCSKFDLSKRGDQKKCFHFTNLQPLWAKDNIRKSNNEGGILSLNV